MPKLSRMNSCIMFITHMTTQNFTLIPRYGVRASRMSLSMDFGTPTTEQTTPERSHSAWIACNVQHK